MGMNTTNLVSVSNSDSSMSEEVELAIPVRPDYGTTRTTSRPRAEEVVDERDGVRQEKKHGWLIDWSEPLYLICGLCGILILVYSFFLDSLKFLILSSGILVILTCLCAWWRVRTLGVAMALMDSINELREENDEYKRNNQELEHRIGVLDNSLWRMDKLNDDLQESNDEIQSLCSSLTEENIRFSELLGILGGATEDLEETKRKLFQELIRLKEENARYEANNLMNLFFLVDRDKGGTLGQKEIEEMNGFTMAVYGVSMDANAFDRNQDGEIDIGEFLERFKMKLLEKREKDEK